MTVRPVFRKEMDFQKQLPSNEAPTPPQNAEEQQIPDHTHPECRVVV